MTYFELFEIPVSLKIDKTQLPARFFELSRRFHPDYHINLSAEEQSEALEKAAILNKAYKTFQDPDATIKYVLELKGLLEEEEKYQLPPDFLMEVLDINEQLMDPDGLEKEKVEKMVGSLQQEIYEPVQKIVEHYQEGVTGEKELLQVKEYYYKKKYLDRIKRQLQNS
jgi:molecular chaperone HscB